MKTLLFLLVVFSVAHVSAQAPPAPTPVPPAEGAPAAAVPAPGRPAPAVTNVPTVRTGSSFFSRPGATSTNVIRPLRATGTGATPTTAVPAIPTAQRPAIIPPPPGAPGAAAAAAAGAVPPAPGQPGPTPQPGGAQTPLTLRGVPSGPTNVVPKGITDVIGANMIRFQEADISQIFELYSELTGKTILRSPQVPANVKITVRNQTPLTRQEGIDALNTILGLNQITMVDLGEKFVEAVPATIAGTEAPKFSDMPYDDLPDAKKIVAQIVQLKNIAPEEVTAIIQPFASLPNSIVALRGSPVVILRDYAVNVKRMMEVIEKVDVAQPVEFEPVVIPIRYALAGEVAAVLSGLSAGGTTVSFGTGAGAGGGLGTSGGSFGTGFQQGGFGGSRFGGGVGGFGSQGYGGYGVRPYGTATPISSTLGARGSTFGNRLSSAVQRAVGTQAGAGAAADEIQLIGQAKIIADERSNALLVFADKRDLPMITNIISKLDVVLPQVLIEALIMEVNLGDGKSLGVSLRQNQQDMGKLSTAGASGNPFDSLLNLSTNISGGGGLIYLGKYSDDFEFAVTAAANDSRINVLSRPRVVTSTAKAASIFVGETRPYVTGTYFSDFGGAGSRSQYSQTQIGINLSVLPIINQEGLVTMDIQQSISQVGANVQIDGNEVPTTIDRNANAYVAVNDRDTIILGGFISTTKNTGNSGVPFLKDIPGLGMLFRSSSENITRVELIVLIRPTVLPTPEAAALQTATERDRLPAVRRAEREEEEFQQRQQEKARREEEAAERRRR